MLSRFKNMPGVAWLVIGVCVTALVLPSAAYATGVLKQVGIEGTSTNRADVTPAGQLLTTEAQPANLFGGSSADDGNFVATTTSGNVPIFIAPSTKAVIMESLSLDVYDWSTTAGSSTGYELYLGNSSCSAGVSLWYVNVNPTGYGLTEMPLAPGVAIPAGDALCAVSIAGSGLYAVEVTATGSLVPSGSVTNAPLHAQPVMP